MTYKTFAQMKAQIQRELDLEQETFVQSDEYLDYFNLAIEEAQASIHKLGVEDNYFKTTGNIALTSGTATVALPSNIYATKIKELTYSSGSTIYPIRRLRGKDKLLTKKLLNQTNAGGTPVYQYDLTNTTADAGIKLEFVPTPSETSTTNVWIEFIRVANIMTTDADKCDIPQFYSFILAFVRWKIKDKEGMPDSDAAKADYERERQLMVETLENQVPDEESSIEQDTTHYEEST